MSDVNIKIANFAEGIPGLANDIHQSGLNFEIELDSIYGVIKKLHESGEWQGKRYDSLRAAFEEQRQVFQSMVNLLMTTLPGALNTAALNYANVNGDVPGKAASTERENIVPLEMTNGTGYMMYDKEAVESEKGLVETHFDNVERELDRIEGVVNQMSSYWNSAAARAYIDEFASLKAKVAKSISSVKNDFTTLMNTAASEITETETNSTVTNA